MISDLEQLHQEGLARVLVMKLSEGQRVALYDAQRFYEDMLGLLVPPMHDIVEIAAAREKFAHFGIDLAHPVSVDEHCSEVMQARTGLDKQHCDAWLVLDAAGHGQTRSPGSDQGRNLHGR